MSPNYKALCLCLCAEILYFFNLSCMLLLLLNSNFLLLTHPQIVLQLQQYFGYSARSWVRHMKSSRVWLDAWLAGLCACALCIALLRRAFDVSSSITYELSETWLSGNANEDIVWYTQKSHKKAKIKICLDEYLLKSID